MATIRCMDWRAVCASFILMITGLLALTYMASAQSGELFQRIDGRVVMELSAEQQQRVAALEQDKVHGPVELVTVDPATLQRAAIGVSLAGDGIEQFTLLERIDRGPGAYTWIGVIGDYAQTTLVVSGDDVTGVFSHGNDRFSLKPVGDGLHALTKINYTAFPKKDHPEGYPPAVPRDPLMQKGDASGDGRIEVDILGVYTQQALNANANIVNDIQVAVDRANTAYLVSNANVRLRLVDTMLISGYNENSSGYAASSYNGMLYDVTGYNPNTGQIAATPPLAGMAAVHTRRNQVGADLVALFSQRSGCGVAWMNSTAAWGFSVTTQECILNETFAHEVGHNFGAYHDVANSPGNKPFAYGHGYIHPQNQWRTIQAYGDPCNWCPRLNRFSNPSLTHNGAVTGTAATHDVARVHRERVATVAAFRAPVNTGTKAAMTSPTQGSTLTTTTRVFQWNTGSGVGEYHLYVGSTGVGSANIYNQSTGTATSRSVSNLPASGTVYVRLYSKIGSVWEFNDYTYTMNAGVKAVMTSPSLGTLLTNTTTTFTWNAGSGVSEYHLYVGTRGVGSANIYNQSTGTARSRSVSGLPATGEIFVRLYSKIGAAWQHNDYIYAMNAGARAVMSSPAQGSILTNTNTTFRWTTGSGVARYHLYVGTTGVGSANLHNQLIETSTSSQVSNLPFSGTIYVRLFSQIGGVWEHNDYTYTMNASGAKAVMTSPSPSSELTTTTVTFSWTAGSGVTDYHLYVGSTGVGSANIGNYYTGTTRSQVVTGLPASGTIYVRLFSKIRGAWQHNDYTYRMNASDAKAVMTSPSPSSMLTTTTTTFSWTAGSGVTDYHLYVGSTGPGSVNIANHYTGTTRSQVVTGLPTSGTIYVRLFSKIRGAWQHNDYTYTMGAGGTKAVMTWPSHGSVLVNSSATFQWSVGSGVTQYWIEVGTTAVGSTNIATVNTGTARTHTVSGLPGSGTIYVRLWSRIAGAWQYNDYTYTRTGTSLVSQLISPSNGSTLGTSQYASWSSVSGATEYWLDAGTTPNGTQLLNVSLGTTTSGLVEVDPNGGAPIYARLWTRHGGVWRYVSYYFTGPTRDAQVLGFGDGSPEMGNARVEPISLR